MRRPRVLTRDELDTPPQGCGSPMPEFPMAAQERWAEGRVTVDFLVDESGRVRVPTVQSATADEFAAATLDILREWQFEASRRHGRPAVYVERWTFDFRKSGVNYLTAAAACGRGFCSVGKCSARKAKICSLTLLNSPRFCVALSLSLDVNMTASRSLRRRKFLTLVPPENRVPARHSR